MPTGYTASVQDGKITEFRDFAMQCARAFGATITMRDDPSDAPIPEAFEPENYNAKRLIEAQEEIARLNAMTDDEKAAKEIREAREEERRRSKAYDRWALNGGGDECTQFGIRDGCKPWCPVFERGDCSIQEENAALFGEREEA